ncbi:MAG: GNAT family N-acetyltransferase [Oceanicaulis sp.]|nr:GNAT family N-acetyltransferase [Oceanicaulis sp.]
MSKPNVRYRIALDTLPDQPSAPPPGVVWALFDAALHAQAARVLLNDAYREGGGAVEDFETWWPVLLGDSEFDPALCFVALGKEDGAMAAFAQCWTSGYVKDIAVAVRWRRKALGRALMRRIFQAFKSRGVGQVELKVEADNPHGALAFYESLGMQAVEPEG